jgi:hypothetical protein
MWIPAVSTETPAKFAAASRHSAVFSGADHETDSHPGALKSPYKTFTYFQKKKCYSLSIPIKPVKMNGNTIPAFFPYKQLRACRQLELGDSVKERMETGEKATGRKAVIEHTGCFRVPRCSLSPHRKKLMKNIRMENRIFMKPIIKARGWQRKG